MDLHYLKLFNALANELNYSKAANTLYISQPAVSMQIKKLESDLGIKLFDKIGKKLHLNTNGKMLFEYTKQIFSLIEEAESSLQKQKNVVSGVIEMGCSSTPGTYILPYILGEFKEKYPQVTINLTIAGTTEIEKMILENKLDFAITEGKKTDNRQLNLELLAQDEVIFIASSANPVSKKDYISPEDLYDLKYVTYSKDSFPYKLLENILNELGLPFEIELALGSMDAVKQSVSANLGISAIPKSCIKYELELGLLKELRFSGKKWFYPYRLTFHKNKSMSPSMLRLISLIKLRMEDLYTKTYFI